MSTQPVREQRPTGEALEQYELALSLEREAGELVRHSLTADKLEEAERLRGLAKEAWAKYRETLR